MTTVSDYKKESCKQDSFFVRRFSPIKQGASGRNSIRRFCQDGVGFRFLLWLYREKGPGKGIKWYMLQEKRA